MAWTDLSFPSNSLLTSLKMTQLDENFDAVVAGNAGAPALNVNSFMVSGVASLATLNISSGGRTLQVFSGTLFNASSGFNTGQQSSAGLFNASSGFNTLGVSCFGSMQANSPAPAAPVAGQFYRDSAIRAWCVCSANGTIDQQMGVSAVANPATGIYVITLATSFSNAQWCPIATMRAALNQIGPLIFDPRSQSGGIVVLGISDLVGTARSEGFSFVALGA